MQCKPLTNVVEFFVTNYEFFFKQMNIKDIIHEYGEDDLEIEIDRERVADGACGVRNRCVSHVRLSCLQIVLLEKKTFF